MAPELKWLCYSAIFAASLWIPYIIGVNTTEFPGKKALFIRPPDPGNLQPWVHRSLRAHQNLLEQLLPFAIIVLIGAVAGVSKPPLAALASIFFWLRVAHAAGMISGVARFPFRPLVYFCGWIVTLLYAFEVLSSTSVRT